MQTARTPRPRSDSISVRFPTLIANDLRSMALIEGKSESEFVRAIVIVAVRRRLARRLNGQAGNVTTVSVADRVLAHLKQQNERQTVTAIKAAIRGKGSAIAPALELLRREGKADCVPGTRRAQLWAATEPGQTVAP